MQQFTFTTIGTVESCFREKFGIPRQPGLAPDARGRIRLVAPYHTRDALIDLEGCSHIWVQFVFHLQKGRTWKARIKAPRLGGNRRLSVFASRSPKRPNPIGLSVLALHGMQFGDDEAWLQVSGLDLVDGTPVLDIKPYVPYADCLPQAVCAYAASQPTPLPVDFGVAAEMVLSGREQMGEYHWRRFFIQVLQQDPRPAFHNDDKRIYGARFGDWEVRWIYHAWNNTQRIEVVSIEPVQ